MNIISLKCQSCGATLEINENQTVCFCSYCGNKHLIKGDQKEVINRFVDEAKLREIEIAQEREIERQTETEKRKKSTSRMKMIIFALWVISVVILGILSCITADNVGFSPYQLVLFPVVVFGIVVIFKQIKTFFK